MEMEVDGLVRIYWLNHAEMRIVERHFAMEASHRFNKEKRKLVWEPKIITGGKTTGNGGSGNNWLNDLAVGTCFRCKDQMEPGGVILHEYHIINKTDLSVKLLDNTTNKDVNLTFWVDPVAFSKRHLKHEIVGVTEDEGNLDVDE